MRRRRRGRKGRLRKRSLALAIAVLPLLYLFAALIGSLIPVNRSWSEPDDGVTVYLADNGIHADLIMPAVAAGVDWRPLFPRHHFSSADPDASWIAFGMGEERVYLHTPRWVDISPRTIWSALTGGKRVMHVEWVPDRRHVKRELRLRPEEYRRLWAAVRADLELDSARRPERIDYPGYGPADAFYRGRGKASVISTCNNWVADKLRIAGIEASLWPPFAQGLLWRYRKAATERTG